MQKGLYKRRLGKVQAIDSCNIYSAKGKRDAKRLISRIEKRRSKHEMSVSDR